jgi:magnesium-transporting ATPase (P-type)
MSDEEVVIHQFPWHASTQDECFKELGLDDSLDDTLRCKGLSSEEAMSRHTKYGHNQLTAKEKFSLLQKIWHQVAGVVIGVLVFVAIVSVVRAATADNSNDVTAHSIIAALLVFSIS